MAKFTVLLGTVVALLCFFTLALHTAWAQPGTLHIACGAPVGYTDFLGESWVPDDAYIATGEVGHSNADVTLHWPNWQELVNNRNFPDASRAKNCYSLPTLPRQTYFLRAEFMFGLYNNASQVPPYPSFQLAIDSSVVENVTIFSNAPYFDVMRELTFAASRDVTSFCLLRDATGSTPFINSISLRPVTYLPQTVLQWLGLNQSVSTMTRLYLNQSAGSIWYNAVGQSNSDIYDRYWFGTNNSGTYVSSYPLYRAGLATSATPLEFLTVPSTTTVNISTAYSEANVWRNVPQGVFQGALTTSGNLTFPLNATTPFRAFIQYYFVELDATVNLTDRSFFIDQPGGTTQTVNVFNLTGGPLSAVVVHLNDTFLDSTSKIVMYPDPARTNLLKGPMLSAMEVFKVGIPWITPTNGYDYSAIEMIKEDMSLTSWGGDPCQPVPHEWLTCSNLTEATVTGILLSGSNLTGAISPAFNQLLSITSLNLDNNYLKGPIPDLRALKNLKILHLQNNNLTGPLPAWLASLPLQELFVQNNELSGEFPSEFLNKNWNFSYSGNPSLTPGSPSTKSNIGAIIGGVVAGIVAVGVVLGIIFFSRNRRRRGKKNVEDPFANPANPGGARQYSLAEVDAATEHYKKVIGKGGFGTVYYGRLLDGTEIAVKALDMTSKQGQSEFFNEVDILSRVHHKHLVSLLGYCNARGKKMLVYEYLHKGSLRDHLDGEFSKTGSEMLDWKDRLKIGLQAALGLEYLHTGCSPSLIHRDVKSNNILITYKNDAKVADFGLTRLVGLDESTLVQTQVKGTPGYLDPEYYFTQLLSAKSDVYSFGVVLLELITGRHPITPTDPLPNLCEWTRSKLMHGNIDAILDPQLRASCPSQDALWKVAEIAMQSVDRKSEYRPTMQEVAQELHDAVALEAENSQPPPPPHLRISPSAHSNHFSNPNSNPDDSMNQLTPR